MIAIDTSALVAIVRDEPEARRFGEIIASRPILVGTPTLVEASMVLPSVVDEPAADKFLRSFIAEPWVEPVAFSFEMFEAAKRAFQLFGKGRHPAKLNFGDCLSYALAQVRNIPLLYKGGDFARTDIRSALAS